jgi:hypothetical protein
VTQFDHLRVADEAQFTFDRAFRALAPRLPPGLPIWGMGEHAGGRMRRLRQWAHAR